MKKFLRISLVALFATLCNSVFAEEIIWAEYFSTYAANEVPAGGDFGYVCTGTTKIYNEKLSGGEAPELLIGKSNGSFAVTIPMNGKSGELTLAFKANYDRITVTAENATLGEKSATGTDYSYPVTVAAGVEKVTFTFTNTTASNVRFDNARLYQGVAKKPAGLSWGTASREVTIGSEDNKFPTLTNANNLPISYSSDNTEVATIDAEGVITLVAAGTANITAEFEGNDEFEEASVSYKLTVKAPADPSEDISNTPETAYTVAQAFELITAGKGLDYKVYVKGYITDIKEVSTQYGNATYYLNDENAYTAETALTVFRGYYLNGEKFSAEDQIKEGDVVIVYGKLVDYNGTKEFTTGSQIYSINGVGGAELINADDADVNAPVYNLLGQPVSRDTKGEILVKNGKKFINK
ncbi:MAG: Ig-like domain-containing protein [Muribaculaceae bacterium]